MQRVHWATIIVGKLHTNRLALRFSRNKSRSYAKLPSDTAANLSSYLIVALGPFRMVVGGWSSSHDMWEFLQYVLMLGISVLNAIEVWLAGEECYNILSL